ncbi:hypothetical protein [Lactiplantibacillus plajomi]|uniref:Uncharacterized protein n=1 Tax=Lactiplantibacillus plajomi TaxID=1457217 RepID=A0ABV6K2W5_9LACO|nr:hypothetical protein [Lactiplantibacillus plajomi]
MKQRCYVSKNGHFKSVITTYTPKEAWQNIKAGVKKIKLGKRPLFSLKITRK